LAHHDPIGLIAPHAGLAQLNERSRDIFRQIVESYLATGEPVGSRNISRLIAMPLSPASVRNVMSDLEQLGLIYAPHTSAGRLPTELGLRFFVDALMQLGDLTEAERQSIQSQLSSVGRAQSVEAALGEALTRLSGLTRAAAVVLTAKSNSRLKHIEFVRLEPERALVVLVGEDGQVENRVLPLPPGVPPSALTEASNFLNARIRGRTLAEARLELETALTQDRTELDQLTQKVIAAGIASWSGGDNEDRQLIVRGHANLLEDLHALEDLERVRSLFDDLETKERCRNALAHGPAFERRLRRNTFPVALSNEAAFPRHNERRGQSFGRLERGIHGSFEFLGVDFCRQRILRQHVAHGPQLGRGIGQSALDGDRLEIHGALADRERDATLAPEIFGRPGHAVGERDVDRLVGAVDDRLAELCALSVGRREKPDIFGREIGRKAGQEYS
jgi:heat-inducible transcriptional repressor